MSSSVNYILIIILASGLIMSGLFFMAWATVARHKYLLVWSLAYVLAAILFGVHISKDSFDSPTSYIMLISILSMSSVSVGAYGHCLRSNVTIYHKTFLSALTLVILATYYFSAISPHIGLSLSLYLYFDATVLIINSVLILKKREKALPADIACAAIHAIYGFILMAASTIGLLQGSEPNEAYAQLSMIIRFTCIPIAIYGMGVSGVFMVASDFAEEMRTLAMTDSLTQCLNRRGFFSQAEHSLKDFKNKAQHVCLIYWDIDNFKAINDHFGHAGGDLALVAAANCAKKHIKSNDLIGRIGGEEFVILVGRASYADAVNVAERLRSLIAKESVSHKKQTINITASFGVVDVVNIDSSIERAVNEADNALYIAKESGRNKVVFAS